MGRALDRFDMSRQRPGARRPPEPTTATQFPAHRASDFLPGSPGWNRYHRNDPRVPLEVRESGGRLGPRTGNYATSARSPDRPGGSTPDREYSSGNNRRNADGLDHSRVPREEHRRPYEAGAPGLPARPAVFYQHAESEIAREMRREALERQRQGDTTPVVRNLVLDNGPCGSRGFDRRRGMSCDEMLPDMLPPGSQLNVWVTTDGGQSFSQRTYDGTGAYIDPGFTGYDDNHTPGRRR